MSRTKTWTSAHNAIEECTRIQLCLCGGVSWSLYYTPNTDMFILISALDYFQSFDPTRPVISLISTLNQRTELIRELGCCPVCSEWKPAFSQKNKSNLYFFFFFFKSWWLPVTHFVIFRSFMFTNICFKISHEIAPSQIVTRVIRVRQNKSQLFFQ